MAERELAARRQELSAYHAEQNARRRAELEARLEAEAAAEEERRRQAAINAERVAFRVDKYQVRVCVSVCVGADACEMS